MYRRYEDPYILEEQLKTAKAELELLDLSKEEDSYTYMDMLIYIAELEDRINFAWQDREYDESEN